ncbi:hypothetical protein EJ03DRAFT_365203 [Teratosphaeria nubilosa]|uniref:Uncharacterized protein n=1 Tax=Teratosphaeria nubilosa TaxID=161662 RepID=A0A6G1L4I2_9PEZI|nr:hypothetical protein EJ03DRAFT_365203 [Teratosphaeria nubilosa]
MSPSTNKLDQAPFSADEVTTAHPPAQKATIRRSHDETDSPQGSNTEPDNTDMARRSPESELQPTNDKPQVESDVPIEEISEAIDSANKLGNGKTRSARSPGSEATTIPTAAGIVDEEAGPDESAMELLEEKWESDPEFFASNSSSNQHAALRSSSPPEFVPGLSDTTASTLFDIHRGRPSNVIDVSRGTASATFFLLDDISSRLNEAAVGAIIRKRTLLGVVESAAQDFIAEHPDRFVAEDDADVNCTNVPKARQSADAAHAILKENLYDAVTAGDAKLALILDGIDRVRDYMRVWASKPTSHSSTSTVDTTPSKSSSAAQRISRKRNATEMSLSSDPSPLTTSDDADQLKTKKPRKAAAASPGPKPWSLAEDLQIIRMKSDKKVWDEKGDSDSVTAQRKKVFDSWRQSMGLQYERTWDAMEQHLNKIVKKDKVTASQLESQLGLRVGEEITKAVVDMYPASTSSKSSSRATATTSEDSKKADQEDRNQAAATSDEVVDVSGGEKVLERAEAEIEADAAWNEKFGKLIDERHAAETKAQGTRRVIATEDMETNA